MTALSVVFDDAQIRHIVEGYLQPKDSRAPAWR